MGFSIGTGVPVITVFIQGLLSFFSPCVLPLVPLYISYLAGGAKTVDENGRVTYPRRRVMVNTLFFVLGISFTFFVLGFGFSALGRFFSNNRTWFARISGMIMVLFGLYQLGALGHSGAIEREHRLPFNLSRFTMNPVIALLLGFTFSFAWTPCVGPTLGSVLLMVSSAGQKAHGHWLSGVYTLGFVIPFLAVGLFTGSVLDFFRNHQSVVRYTVKIGGVLLILMGLMTFTGYMNGITSYLSSFGGAGTPQTQQTAPQTPGGGQPSDESGLAAGDTGTEGDKSGQSSGETGAEGGENGSATGETAAQPGGGADQADTAQETTAAEEPDVLPAFDFTLTDQYGNSHTLSDYKGKTVFLNFWATWCPPCKREMPEIQALYERYGENEGDLIVLGVANPKTEEHPGNSDETQDVVEKFLKDNGYTFPVVMDLTGDTFSQYMISAFPTTFMIDKDGNVFGYASGSLSGDMMESIVQQTMTGIRQQ